MTRLSAARPSHLPSLLRRLSGSQAQFAAPPSVLLMPFIAAKFPSSLRFNWNRHQSHVPIPCAAPGLYAGLLRVLSLTPLAPVSKGKHLHLAGIQVIARGNDLEFAGSYPFGKNGFSLL
jgi:hypothetical protein